MMPRVHDLLELSTPACIRIAEDAPAWASVALRTAPFAVVCRDRRTAGTVVAGIRGNERSQRYALDVGLLEVERVHTPESLACVPAARPHPVFEAMRVFASVARRFDLPWGPAGAAGFELATGVAVLHDGSDFDAIVRVEPHDARLRPFARLLRAIGVRVDVELSFADGCGVALEEALRGGIMLVKTPDGPHLTEAEALA
jgi:phosphoribosyl-dephospho-CoA transferase